MPTPPGGRPWRAGYPTTTSMPTVNHMENDKTEKQARTENNRAARDRLRPVLNAARQVRLIGKTQRISAPGFQQKAQELLDATVEWRGRAMEFYLVQGEQIKPRPKFAGKPDLGDPAKPPNRRIYQGRLGWWASRYAWDKADGLPLAEATGGLLHTAIVGYAQEVRIKNP